MIKVITLCKNLSILSLFRLLQARHIKFIIVFLFKKLVWFLRWLMFSFTVIILTLIALRNPDYISFTPLDLSSQPLNMDKLVEGNNLIFEVSPWFKRFFSSLLVFFTKFVMFSFNKGIFGAEFFSTKGLNAFESNAWLGRNIDHAFHDSEIPPHLFSKFHWLFGSGRHFFFSFFKSLPQFGGYFFHAFLTFSLLSFCWAAFNLGIFSGCSSLFHEFIWDNLKSIPSVFKKLLSGPLKDTPRKPWYLFTEIHPIYGFTQMKDGETFNSIKAFALRQLSIAFSPSVLYHGAKASFPSIKQWISI